MAQQTTSTPSSTQHPVQDRTARPDAAHSIRQAAALVLLASLAACGSGSGDSAEPASQLQTKAEAAASQNAEGSSPSGSAASGNGNAQPAADGSQTGGTGGQSGNAAAGNGDAAEQPASPVSAAAPLSDQGVRGDVVATALRTVGGAENGADSTTESILGGITEPSNRHIGTDNLVADHVRRIHAAEGEDTALGPFTWEDGIIASTKYTHRHAIAQTRLLVGLSASGTLPDETKNAAADAEVIQIGAQARLTFPQPFPGTDTAPSQDLTWTYQAQQPASIRKDTVYAYDSTGAYLGKDAIQSWTSPSPDNEKAPKTISILLDRSELKNSFKLCVKISEYDASAVNRLNCDTWEVPEGWSPGHALIYKGHNLSIREWYDLPIIGSNGEIIGTEPTYQWHGGKTEALKKLQAKTSGTDTSGAEASDNAGTPSGNTGNAAAASDGKATQP